MNAPKYFLSVFGDPKPPDKDAIESGIYHPDSKFAPFQVKPGDFLLLYCTAGYTKYSKTAPGIGVVVEITNQEIRYRYLPLTRAISRDELHDRLGSVDKKKLQNIRFSSHWLFEISRQSFLDAVNGRGVHWP